MNFLSSGAKKLLIAWCLLTLIFFSGCDKTGCIPADSVGGDRTTTIKAKPSKDDYIAANGDNGSVDNFHQVVRWIDTGLEANGSPLIIKILGRWSAWMGDDENAELRDQDLGNNRICTPEEGTESDGRHYWQSGYKIPLDDPNAAPPTTDYYKDLKKRLDRADGEDEKQRAEEALSLISNAKYGMPCWNRNGYGAYILLKEPGVDVDPNSNLEEIKNPTHPTTHLFYHIDQSNGYGQFDSSKTKFWYGDGREMGAIKRGSRIYVKIMDNYYEDNIGSYDVRVQSGYMMAAKDQIFDKVNSAITNILSRNTEKLFTQITENRGYRNFVYGVITVYILFSALSYAMGLAQAQTGDIMMRLLKIAIISQFLMPNAWGRFCNILLDLYLKGVAEVIGIALSTLNPEGFDPAHPFQALDLFFINFFSEDVWIKIGSMFAIDILALVWMFFMFLMIGFFLWVCLYAFMIYLTSMTVISIVIVCMPFLFLALLFPTLKPVIDGWFCILMSYSLQAIMIFCLVSMFINLIMLEIYKSIGFPACKNLIMRVGLIGAWTVFWEPESFTPGNDYLSFNWYLWPGWGTAVEIAEESAVDIIEGSSADSKVIKRGAGKAFVSWILGSSIESEKIITVHPDKAVIKVPPDYIVEEERYVNLPFLHLVEDKEKIDMILNRGRILDLGGTIMTFLICYTLFVLRQTVVEIAQHLSGASMLSGLATQGLLNQMIGQQIDSGLASMQDKIATARPFGMPSLDMIDRHTSRITGGASVHSKTQSKIADHKRFVTLNRYRDKVGVGLDTTKRALNLPEQVVESAANLDSGHFTDYLGSFKGLGNALGDNIDYADPNQRERIMENFMKGQRDPHIASGLIYDPKDMPDGYRYWEDPDVPGAGPGGGGGPGGDDGGQPRAGLDDQPPGLDDNGGPDDQPPGPDQPRPGLDDEILPAEQDQDLVRQQVEAEQRRAEDLEQQRLDRLQREAEEVQAQQGGAMAVEAEVYQPPEEPEGRAVDVPDQQVMPDQLDQQPDSAAGRPDDNENQQTPAEPEPAPPEEPPVQQADPVQPEDNEDEAGREAANRAQREEIRRQADPQNNQAAAQNDPNNADVDVDPDDGAGGDRRRD